MNRNVVIIPPLSQVRQARIKVAAYARVSSKSKEQLHSYYTQISHYTTYINSVENWEFVDVYADEGISGLRSDNRQEFQRMLADCRAGKIDRILTKSISRFSRNKQHTFSTVHELREIGISVCFEEDNIDTTDLSDATLFSLLSVFAEQESVEIARNARMGIRARMRNGSYLQGTSPYGYRKARGKLVPDDRAPIVCRIYREFLAGTGTGRIAHRLNEDSIPGSHDAGWTASSIRYILTNPNYTGDSLWQKNYTTDTVPFQLKKNKGEMEQFLACSTHEPIISKEDFTKAQEQFEKRDARFSPKEFSTTPFRNRLFCASCGGRCHKRGHAGLARWICYQHEAHMCPAMPVKDDAIQQSFINLYNTLFVNKRNILIPMLKQLQEVSKQIRMSNDIQRINVEMLELTDQNALLQEMRSKRQITEIQLRNHVDGLSRNLKQLRDKKRKYVERTEDCALINNTNQILSIVGHGPEYLYQFDCSLFESLVTKVELVHPGQVVFHLLNGLRLAACPGRKEEF